MLSCDFVTGALLSSHFQQVLEGVLVIGHEIPEELVAIEQDDHPLLDDIGVQRVLLVVHEGL